MQRPKKLYCGLGPHNGNDRRVGQNRVMLCCHRMVQDFVTHRWSRLDQNIDGVIGTVYRLESSGDVRLVRRGGTAACPPAVFWFSIRCDNFGRMIGEKFPNLDLHPFDLCEKCVCRSMIIVWIDLGPAHRGNVLLK